MFQIWLGCIDWQLMWYHWLHVSHTIPLSCHVTGWSHVPHGYTVSFVSEHPVLVKITQNHEMRSICLSLQTIATQSILTKMPSLTS
jgi:hypothetical protein